MATLSSLTSLREGRVSGGAGSVGATGIGRGTSRMEYSKSGGDTSSMGYIDERVEMSEFRSGGSSERNSDKRALQEMTIFKVRYT